MQELALAVQQAQAAVVAGDLRDLKKQTTRQRELCQLLREPDPGPRSGTQAGCELQAAARHVAQMNRVLGALLRRARRSVEIIALAHASRADTYLPRQISQIKNARTLGQPHV